MDSRLRRAHCALGLLILVAAAGAYGRSAKTVSEDGQSCWGEDEDWNLQSPAFLEQATGSSGVSGDPWSQIGNTFGSGVEWLFKLMPGMRGKLYGRSLTPPCRCEACAYTLDTLIMYLDEDTMGWYTPEDIQHIMMDRFCYGIKWLYRSACHHILTAYFDDIAAMAMGHMTGLDICRVLRFCPYYYSGGNLAWSNMRAMPFMGGGGGGGSTAQLAQGSAANQALLERSTEGQQSTNSLSQGAQQGPPQPQQPQQQPFASQVQPPPIEPVGYHSNPAAQQAAQYQSLMGAGGGV